METITDLLHALNQSSRTKNNIVPGRDDPTQPTALPARMKDCCLLQLPAELRNEIWYLALPRSLERELYDDLCIQRYPGGDEKSQSFKLPLWEPGNVAILRANRQIHDEALAIFWKSNSFTLFPRGRRNTKIALAFVPEDENERPIQHLKSFYSIREDHAKLIRRWSLVFETAYSGETTAMVTEEKMAWDKAKRIMPTRIIADRLIGQYLPFKFITRIAVCSNDEQSRLSYKQSAFAHLVTFLNTLSFVLDFRYVDVGVGESSGLEISGSRATIGRCQHVYSYRNVKYRPGEALIKAIPRLLAEENPPRHGSVEDQAFSWLELEGASTILTSEDGSLDERQVLAKWEQRERERILAEID